MGLSASEREKQMPALGGDFDKHFQFKM